MNLKKYAFFGEEKVFYGRTLRRIKALRDIESYAVKAGDLGGWIESEKNLSHEGNAWVSGNAWVYGDARVLDGKWEWSPLYIQGSRYALYMATPNKVGVGCKILTFAGWHRGWRKIAERFGLAEAEQREYIAYFNLACDRYGGEKYKIAWGGKVD